MKFEANLPRLRRTWRMSCFPCPAHARDSKPQQYHNSSKEAEGCLQTFRIVATRRGSKICKVLATAHARIYHDFKTPRIDGGSHKGPIYSAEPAAGCESKAWNVVPSLGQSPCLGWRPASRRTPQCEHSVPQTCALRSHQWMSMCRYV